MAKMFRDSRTGSHIPYRERKSLSGTARYMSINTHLGREQSRRDDLESIGHVMFYLLRGCLPWQGLKAASNKEKYERIGSKKQQTSISDLGAGLPQEFGRFLEYCRSLPFEADPDYGFLIGLLRNVITCHQGLARPVDLVRPRNLASHEEQHAHHQSTQSMVMSNKLPPLKAFETPPRLQTLTQAPDYYHKDGEIEYDGDSRERRRNRSTSLWRRLLCLG